METQACDLVRQNLAENMWVKEHAGFKIYLKTSGFADRTIDAYMMYVKLFFKYIREKSIEKLSEVTPETVSQYRIYLTGDKNGKKMSLKTQNLRMIGIMNFFRYLVREKNYLYDPTSHVKLKDPPRKRTREVLSEKEMIRLLNAPNPETPIGLRDKALLELYYSCGIRNSESRSLTVKDVDLENRVVRIRHAKGGEDQTVPIGRVCAVYMEEYIKHSRPKLLKNELEETLFLSCRGKPLTLVAPPRIVQAYALIAGIKRKVDAHTLRHTCGTHLYDHGCDVRCVQELLRHKSLDSTQVYIEVKATKLRQVIEKTHPRERGIVDAPVIN
jgi:integrase/recombinase XerD